MTPVLDMRGPEFLTLYVSLTVVALVLGFILRYLSRFPAGHAPADRSPLTAYQAAYLAGGPRRVVDGAITRLYASGLLRVSATGHRFIAQSAATDKSSGVEGAVIAAASESSGSTVQGVRQHAQHHAHQVGSELEALGLTPPFSGAVPRFLGALPLVAVLCLGIAKVFVGVERHRPVGVLLILIVVSCVLLLGLSRPVYSSHRGDHALRQLKRSNRSLRYAARLGSEPMSPLDLAFAVSLFGAATVSAGQFLPLYSALNYRPQSSGDSSSGSSCSSSSCGGGCGGGCGGCGS